MGGSLVVLIGFLVYLIFILIIGFLTSKLNKSLSDYILGGRKMGPWLLSISERASAESAWLIVGFTGTALSMGLKAIWIAVGCVLGIIFNWIFIAKRLYNASKNYDALTVPDYLSSRFKDTRHTLRIISSVIILIFYVLYVSAQFMGAGKMFNTTFGISNTVGILIGAGIIIFYTTLGGFSAVVWTDLFQGLIMVFGLVILPILAVFKLGGFSHVISTIKNTDPSFLNVFYPHKPWASFLLVLSGFGWGLGYMGQPHLLARFMAFNDKKNFTKGITIAIVWSLLAYTGAIFIGIIGVALLKNPQLMASIGKVTDPEHIYPLMALKLLPGVFAGIVISGAIAAMMSTADSQLLVCTSTITEDFIVKLGNKKMTPKKNVTISRISTILLGLFALGLGFLGSKVFDQVLHAWAGLGASIGPVVLLSLYWKKSSKTGAIVGMLAGFFTVVIWNLIPFLKHKVFDNEIVPAFILAVLGIFIFSLLFPNKEEAK